MVTQIGHKKQVLQALLPSVAKEGWSDKGLKKAVTDSGMEEAYMAIIFPEGVKDAMAFYFSELYQQIEKQWHMVPWENMPVRQRVAEALKTSLEVMSPDKKIIEKTVIFFIPPWQWCKASQYAWKIVDNMWYKAGDKATDWNYYTKRILLWGIYNATLLYWLKDTSEGAVETKRFIDRRIEDVMQIMKVKWKVPAPR